MRTPTYNLHVLLVRLLLQLEKVRCQYVIPTTLCNYIKKLPLCICELQLPLSRVKEKLEHAAQNPSSCPFLACLSQPPHAFTAR